MIAGGQVVNHTLGQREDAPGYKQIDPKPCKEGDMYRCCPKDSDNEVSPPNCQEKESGICSWYGAEGEIPQGWPTASGEGFDRFAMKAAHKTLPFGTKIRVRNSENGKTVDLVINDPGPFTPGRIVDLTFGLIENHDKGVVPCSYSVI